MNDRTILFVVLIVAASGAFMGDMSPESTDGTSVNDCYIINACPPDDIITDPISRLRADLNLPPIPPNSAGQDTGNFNLLTAVAKDRKLADDANRKMRLDTALSRPYRPNEFVTFELGFYKQNYPGAILQTCPCDTNLAVIDYSIIPAEEKEDVAQRGKAPSGEGSGNAIFPRPRPHLPPGENMKNYAAKVFETWGTLPTVPRTDKKAKLIAILDSGVDSHILDSLKARKAISLSGYKQFIDPSAPENDVTDEYGHGSNVTSVIDHYANGNARYLIYKTHDQNGNGTTFSVLCGLRCAVQNGADIINMSWGVYDSLTPLMNELDSIASLKSPPIMVASMGNEGISVDNNVHYPSDHEDVLAVTGLAIGLHPSDVNPYVNNYPDEVHWACSNYSFQTNRRYIAAPCALTLRDDPVAAQGTSYAAAMVTGRLANLDRRCIKALRQGSSSVMQNPCEDILHPLCNQKGQSTTFSFYTIR